MYECMETWVHECMETWVHECIETCICGCIHVYGCMEACVYTKLQINLRVLFIHKLPSRVTYIHVHSTEAVLRSADLDYNLGVNQTRVIQTCMPPQ